MDDLQTPAPEAGDEDVRADIADAASEATENTEGQDEDGQPADDQSDDQPSKAKQRRERRKAEMEQLRRERDEANERAQKLQSQRERITKAAEADTPPKESDFADYNEFLMAGAAFRAARVMDDRRTREIDSDLEGIEEQARSAQSREQAAIMESWQEQVAEAKARYADFDKVALSNDVPITPLMGDVIRTSEQGADLAYHLGKNRQVAAQIAQMAPLEAARTLGAIEARLTQPKPNTVTQAPDPVAPTKSRGGTPSLNPDKMSMAEYRKARAAGRL